MIMYDYSNHIAFNELALTHKIYFIFRNGGYQKALDQIIYSISASKTNVKLPIISNTNTLSHKTMKENKNFFVSLFMFGIFSLARLTRNLFGVVS